MWMSGFPQPRSTRMRFACRYAKLTGMQPSTDEILAKFEAAGGVMQRAALRRTCSADRIQHLIESGALAQPRHGILMAEEPTTPEATALALGGNLTCVTLIKQRGYWTPRNSSTHVRLPKHRFHNAALHAFVPAAKLHHLRGHDLSTEPETLSTVLRCAEQCCERDELIAIMESFLRGDTHSRTDIATAVASGRAKLRQAYRLVEFGADSGVETLVRVRLRELGIKVRTQVKLLEWRVDLLIGEWLIVEVDGYSYHRDRDEFVRDRRKDRALMNAGYHVRRFSYDDVMFEWAKCAKELLKLIRANKHLRPSNAKPVTRRVRREN